tara:strand:+ start:198 stop:668 length:471 start_codon:yes stop_codon:yes gene_type:complete
MGYICDTCSGDFKNPQALKIHQKTHGILKPITGGNTDMADTYCKDCYSKDRKNDKLNDELSELKKASTNDLKNLKKEVNDNQGHISASELIRCQAHGPDAVNELNEQFVMFPREDLKNHKKTMEYAEQIFPDNDLIKIIKNGIEIPDEYFVGNHNE